MDVAVGPVRGLGRRGIILVAGLCVAGLCVAGLEPSPCHMLLVGLIGLLLGKTRVLGDCVGFETNSIIVHVLIYFLM